MNIKTIYGIPALAMALALCGACSLFEAEEPITFEISKVVLPKDIPAPADESKVYPDEGGKKQPGSNLATRTAAAEAQEQMHARATSSPTGVPTPSDLVKVKASDATEGAFLTSKSFVTRWNILGPIAPSIQEPLQEEYIPGEKTVDGSFPAPEGASWNVKVFDGAMPPGTIDFDSIFPGQSKFGVYYASSCLDCPEDVEGATMLTSSTIPVKIWLNGVLVHTFDKGERGLKLDQDAIEGIYLRRGYNRLVVKALAFDGHEGRKFMIRFAAPSGTPISTEP